MDTQITMVDYDRIARVIRYLDAHHLEQPRLSELARVAGLSQFHFHRLFTRWAGTTPKLFLKSLTAAHARALLLDSRDVLSASLEAGLSGPSRLHDLLVSTDGVTPGEYRARGAGLEIRYGVHATPFGDALIGLTQRGVCHLAFTDRARAAIEDLRRQWPRARLTKAPRDASRALSRIFDERPGGTLKLATRGTPFQLKVWETLLRIPPGRVLSYGDIARAIGAPGAARAVGSAVAANPIAYLIPCHRVIRETGIIGEYRWGSERKRAILAHEMTHLRYQKVAGTF